MSVPFLDGEQVRQLLPMSECIDLMSETLAALARGEAMLPLRSVMPLPGGSNFLVTMPGYLGNRDAAGVKVITVYPGNWGTEHESHQGVILLFEAKHGSLRAIVDATSVTAIRTAAVSGAATRALARENPCDLAILGTGVQAATHLEAMLCVRKIRRVRVWSRSPENRNRFAETMSARHSVHVEAVDSPRDAVGPCGLVCATTSSREPVLESEWVAAGTHINAVGSSTPSTRELSTGIVARSSLFTDRLESLIKEAGDFLIPEKEGAVGADHVKGEIGQVFAGLIPGRTSNSQITLFKSLGLAVEDIACAHFLFERSQKRAFHNVE